MFGFGHTVKNHFFARDKMPISIAKLITGNPAFLKELSIEEVLQIHPLLNAQTFQYGTARKTRSIKARPINTILDKTETSIFEDLLLNTLEGAQSLKRGSFICYGEAGDVWQQAGDKLQKKYTPVSVDEDGWITFEPKQGDDALMNVCQVTNENFNLGEFGGFSIINPWWGDERVVDRAVLTDLGIDPVACGLVDADQVKLYLHFGVDGDFILQNRTDSKDTYRVAEKFFNNTYVVE